MRACVRRRTQPTDDVSALHHGLIEGLSRHARIWWRDVATAQPDFGEDLEAQVDLSPGIALGSGYVAYVFRSPAYHSDTGLFDDRLIIELDAGSGLNAHEVLSGLVAAFHAYRGEIEMNEDLALDDRDAAVARGLVTGRDEDGRHGVWRIPPLGFFDDELCRLALGHPASVLGSMLLQAGFRVSNHELGLHLCELDVDPDRQSLIDFDARVRSIIGIARPG